MLSLYEILKASKTGIAPDMWTALAGMNWGGKDSGAEVKELTGIPPLSFTANGQPLLDYLISGNTSQAGTPTPDNPIMPQGTGERTGNLYNINAKDVNNGYVNDARLSQDGTTETWGSAEISEYIPISGDTAYTFNGIGSYNSPCYGLYDENKQLIGAYRYNGTQIIKFTSPNNARYFRFTHIKTAKRAMMVEGAYTASTMPDYEPYGIKIPISSAGQTTPVYLGEVQTTRKIKKLVLTGEENNWQLYQQSSQFGQYEVYQFWLDNIIDSMQYSSFYSTIAPFGATPQSRQNYEYGCYAVSSGKGIAFQMAGAKDTFANITAWKTYLRQQYAAGTPVTVWYVLATETTGIVNEPIRKIGNYADTVSMEQAGVSISTLNGQTVVDVDTTLKPSEMYIKYKG